MRRTTQPLIHVIEFIFQQLPLHDLVRTKSVFFLELCHRIPAIRPLPHAPLLLLLPKQGSTSCRFINVEGNTEETTLGMFHEFHCIGSSFGWLIFLDGKTFSPFLFNPFTDVRTDLPSLKTPFSITRTVYANPYVTFLVSFNGAWQRQSMQHARGQWKYFVTKAVLTGEPVGQYGVV
ncbi:hypothetical protein SLE2022_136220 [Rubroshorea leprosula]